MVLKLSDGTLFQSKALIGENVCESSSGSRVEVLDPATSQVLGTVPEMDSTDTQVAISEAAKALPIWRDIPAGARSELLLTWYQLVLDASEDLATLITAECGKPKVESLGEVGVCSIISQVVCGRSNASVW